MKSILGRGLASLTVGALFGLAMSTTMEDLHAAASGTAAAAYVFATYSYLQRTGRRTPSGQPPSARERQDAEA